MNQYHGITVAEHGAGSIDGYDGWEIVENGHGGLTLLSPRTSASELGYRDDSAEDLGAVLCDCDAD